jgi:ATP-dependent Clp protease protease subunit
MHFASVNGAREKSTQAFGLRRHHYFSDRSPFLPFISRMSRLLFSSVLVALTRFTLAETLPVPASQPAAAAPVAKIDPLQAGRDELAKLQLEREKVTAEIQLAQTQLEKKLSAQKLKSAEMQAAIEEMKTRLDLKEWERKAADDAANLKLRKDSERLALESSIAKFQADIEGYRIRQEENELRRKSSQLTLAMELQQKETEARTWAAGKQPNYLKEPLVGQKLIISDRRIALNGVVTPKTAEDIADRINYFNNRDPEAPIFIVIDDCPGGSVMAGYKILRAMHGSRAPVYTVVKSFAASLAACITTCATKSYAYPNAIILHHQLSSAAFGNLTQQRETVQELEEWWRRLADPIAAKMGITRDEFIKRMYAASSTGDWSEFADDAQKLKWVDVIVDEIEETATLRHPDTVAAPTAAPSRFIIPSQPGHSEVIEGKDERGKPIALLPRLNPLDAYWLYSPDGYFRVQ